MLTSWQIATHLHLHISVAFVHIHLNPSFVLSLTNPYLCKCYFLFFQFEDVSLDSCLWLLDRAQLATAARANPLRIARCISAMVRNTSADFYRAKNGVEEFCHFDTSINF